MYFTVPLIILNTRVTTHWGTYYLYSASVESRCSTLVNNWESYFRRSEIMTAMPHRRCTRRVKLVRPISSVVTDADSLFDIHNYYNFYCAKIDN